MNLKLLVSALFAWLRGFLSLPLGTPLTSLVATAEVDGNLIPAAAQQVMNGGIIAGLVAGTTLNFQTSAGSTATLTALQNLLQRFTVGSAVTVTLDSAYNIVNTIPNAYLGQSFPFQIITNASTTVATPTLSDAAVTLSGTTTMVGAALRIYQAQITQMASTSGVPVTSGTTFTSLTQVGSTNNYTVALGTNALVPVVGQVIYLGVTAGTLPAGWYPVNKVTSATSFVIAAPVAGTAWTATAATVPGTVVAPATYSPLVTITGCCTTVTGTMAV